MADGHYVVYGQDPSNVVHVPAGAQQPTLYTNPTGLHPSHSATNLPTQQGYYQTNTLGHPAQSQPKYAASGIGLPTVAQPNYAASAIGLPSATQPQYASSAIGLPSTGQPSSLGVHPAQQTKLSINAPKYTGTATLPNQGPLYQQPIAGTQNDSGFFTSTIPTQQHSSNRANSVIGLPNGNHSHVHTVADVHQAAPVQQPTQPAQAQPQGFVNQQYVQQQPASVAAAPAVEQQPPATKPGLRIVKRIVKKPVARTTDEGTATPVRNITKIRVVKKKVPAQKPETVLVRKKVTQKEPKGLVEQVQAVQQNKPATKVIRKTVVKKTQSTGTGPEDIEDHDQRVRVLHVTDDGTQSIRMVENDERHTVIKPTTRTTETQTQTEPFQERIITARVMAQPQPEPVPQPQPVYHTPEVSHEPQTPVAPPSVQQNSYPKPEPELVTWNASVDTYSDNIDDSITHTAPEYLYASVIRPSNGIGNTVQSIVDGNDDDDDEEEEQEPPVPEKTVDAYQDGSTTVVQDTGATVVQNTSVIVVQEPSPPSLITEDEAADAIMNAVKDEDPYSIIPDMTESERPPKPPRLALGGATSATPLAEPNLYENLRTFSEVEPTYSDAAKSDAGSSSHPSEDNNSSSLGSALKPSDGETAEEAKAIIQPTTVVVAVAPPAAATATTTAAASATTAAAAPITTLALPTGFRIDDQVNVFFHKCDIVRMKTDVIVNPTNTKMKHDTGLAIGIMKVAGKDIEKDSKKCLKKSGTAAVGDILSTKSGRLSCSVLFHAVCPRYTDYQGKANECKAILRTTYDRVFDTCNAHKVQTLAMPPLGSGKFAVPHYFISACIYESLLAAAVKGNYKYLKEVHVVNLEPSIILPVVDAFIKMPVVPSPATNSSIIITQLERQQVRSCLEQRKIPRKKKKEADGKSPKDTKDSKNAKDTKRLKEPKKSGKSK